ncbi:MAG: hypothetical protein WD022_05735 [Balneolaceae bacterium]
MRTNISDEAYKSIEKIIGSEESVVGIDAKKTHILILHMLGELQTKMEHLEERLERIEESINKA